MRGKSMRAAMLVERKKIEIQESTPPTPADDEVLIEPKRIGVCGSDVSFYLGHRPTPYTPFILGHEVVGHIVGVGEKVTGLEVGQRVIVEPNYTCGNCTFCREGRGNICPNKKSLGVSVPGSFADLAVAPAEFVWPLPDEIADIDAATIEPLAVSVHAVLQSGIQIGDTIAVVGCGVVGLLLTHVAVTQGVRVLALDRYEQKLEKAVQMGAEACEGDDIEKCWLRENVSTVFECAGVVSTVEMALSAAPRGSQVVLLGLSSELAGFVPLRIVREGIRIEPSLIYDHPSDFARTIELVAKKKLQPSIIVTDTIPFTSIGRALEEASTGKSGKIHTVMD
jgi:threonine dehydrogenase-like Zn-dependent dehydrogenase